MFVTQKSLVGETPKQSKDGPAPTGAASKQDARLAKIVQEINAADGRNALERVHSWMLQKVPGHADLDLGRAVAEANTALQNIQSGILPKSFAALDIAEPTSDSETVELLNSMPGRNPVEKANALLCRRSQLHKSLGFAEQCRVAGQFVRELMMGRNPKLPGAGR